MQLTAAGNFEAVHVIGLFHAKGNIGVQLAKQPVSQMSGGHKFSFLSGQRAVIDHKLHGDGRL